MRNLDSGQCEVLIRNETHYTTLLHANEEAALECLAIDIREFKAGRHVRRRSKHRNQYSARWEIE